MFDREKERILIHLIKTKSYPNIVKKLKKIVDSNKLSIINSYFQRCVDIQSEKFAAWRKIYLE